MLPKRSTDTSRSGAFLWPAVLIVTLLVIQVLPMLWFRRYYFVGDTQNAYYPWWHELGEQLRGGHWPLMLPSAWQGSNVIAEGQWGLFSPLTMLIALGATVVPNAVLYVVMVKTGLILIGGGGSYVLGRSFGLARPWAYVLGVAVPLVGAAQFLDMPSWTAGQMAAALLPWAWWSLRRVVLRDANPWPALLVGYLLVTIGYVYATIFLCVILLVVLVDCVVLRNRRAFVRVLLIGLACGLVAITVFLPGVLSASATVRSGVGFIPVGPLQGDIGGMVTAMVPVTAAFGFYVAWFLPMLLWIDVTRLRVAVRDLTGAFVGLAVMAVWTLAPNTMGPLRWPMRVAAVYAFMLLVVAVIVIARCLARPSRGRLFASLGLLAFTAFARLPGGWEMRGHVVVGAAVAAVGLTVTWLLVRWAWSGDHARPAALTAVALFMAVVGIGLQAVQHDTQPKPGAIDRHSPADVSAYKTQLTTARGDVMTIGDQEKQSVADPRVSRSLLIASAWYLNPHPVANVDTAIAFRSYVLRFCMRYNGLTQCPQALGRLLGTEPETGKRWADLLSVSTIVIVRKGHVGRPLDSPPAGWSVTDRDRYQVTWVRDEPVPTAGGVTWTSPGVSLSSAGRSDRQTSFKVTDVPAGGGSVVLSRLAWPGYQVSGARLGSPLQGTLLRVHVTPADIGHTVTVRYSPPHWHLVVASWWAGVLLGLLLILLPLVGRWRRRSRDDEPAAATS